MVNRPFFGKETQQLLNAVDLFAEKMKQRLIIKSTEGYSGWQDLTTPDIISAVEERLPRLLAGEDVEVGVANWLLINFVNQKSYNNAETRAKSTNGTNKRERVSRTPNDQKLPRSRKNTGKGKPKRGSSGAKLFIK